MDLREGNSDTIAAAATALGGAIAVIRISGPGAETVAAQVWRGRRPLGAIPARHLEMGEIVDETAAVVDQVLVVRFAAPASYTGEPMVEFHCHGGSLVVRDLLRQLFRAGARPAEPGEFTKRAFLNGKMDLTQAEAVADIIAAHSDLALHMAQRQLDGRFGRQIAALYARAELLLSELEARLDFPDEDLALWEKERLTAEVDRLAAELRLLLRSRRQGEILRHGIRLVIAGPPNVGKSSLMNVILGRERAIVTSVPGTTRDTLEENLSIRGIPICLIDTAGIRDTQDLVERSGVERAEASLATADVILWVLDAARPHDGQAWPVPRTTAATIHVLNKIDLVRNRAPGGIPAPESTVQTSALTGEGIESLFGRIEQAVWQRVPREDGVAVNERHAALLDRALQYLVDAREEIAREAWELAAISVRGTLFETGKITGKSHTPDILDTIFARFCIGK